MKLKIDAKFEGKMTCAFQNDLRNLANFHKLKNSDYILEAKMAELNQNKNSKQPDRPDSTEINSTELLFLRYKKIFKKALKIGDFLQCLVHIFLGHDDCF